MQYWRKLMRQDGAIRCARRPVKIVSRSIRWQLRLSAGLLLAAAAALLIAAQAREDPPIAPIRFRNVAAAAGIDFVLENSATPEKQLIETMPGGVVAFDYDGDGRIDIFFTNGAAIPSLEKNHVKYRNRLFRNLGGMRLDRKSTR